MCSPICSDFRSRQNNQRLQRQGDACLLVRHWSTIRLNIVCHQRVWVKILISMLAPHTSSRQLPSQTPQSPVTSGQTTFESSSHSSCRPLTPFSAQASASLLCSREVCTAQSSALLRKSTPRPHHFLSRVWAATVASTVVFCSARPLIQSSRVSVSPLVANSMPSSTRRGLEHHGVEISRLLAGDSSTFLHVPSVASSSSRGLSSPSSFRGGCRVNFCIQSSSAPAHLLPLSCESQNFVFPMAYSRHPGCAPGPRNTSIQSGAGNVDCPPCGILSSRAHSSRDGCTRHATDFQSFAVRLLRPLHPCPIPTKTMAQDITYFHDGQVPGFLSAPHLQRRNIFLFVGACPLQRLQTGLHSKSSNSSKMSFTDHAHQLLLVVTEWPIIVCPHHTSG